MEVVGSRPRTVHGTPHCPGHAGVGRGLGTSHDAAVELAADFHVYAVEWTADGITWSLDGTPYGTVERARVPAGARVFDHDFHLLLNLAIGGSWPGNSFDPASLPAAMLIDWVRVRSPHLRTSRLLSSR